MAQHSPRRPRRQRTTSGRAIAIERAAKTVITLGGIGTILAVSLIFIFLVWVVLPLFESPSVGEGRLLEVEAQAPLGIGVDENHLLAWELKRDGTLEVRSLSTGNSLERRRPFGDLAPTAASFSTDGTRCVFGFGDGTVRIGDLAVETIFPDPEELPAELADLEQGEIREQGGGIVLRTPAGQLRRTQVSLSLQDPLPTGSDSPVVAVDHSVAPQGLYLVTLQANGSLRVSRERVKTNMLTGEETRSLRSSELLPADEEQDHPRFVGIGGLGQHAYALWEDGRLEHWDISEWSRPRVYESLDVIEDPTARVGAFAFIAGKHTLVIGDDQGGLTSWFPARDAEVEEAEPLLVQAHTFPEGDGPVRALCASARSRLFAAGYESGLIRVFQATLGTGVAELEAPEGARALCFAPKEDGLIAQGATRLMRWEVDFKYPEANATGLFAKVRYEGFREPQYTWQSSSADDDFEPKLGLMPLIFGTIKATFYSMLFGAPLAILAAIFTSEFLAARLRTSIKSAVELMASLPSVVLGFIAALVIAPFVQDVLPTILTSFLTIPICVLGGAYLWQMLPGDRAVRWAGAPRFLAICLTLPAGILLAMLVGPYVIENLFFAGDLSGWLSGREGSSVGGWLFLLLPLAALVVAIGSAFLVAPRLRRRSRTWSRAKVARLEGFKFVLGLAAAFALALVAGLILNSAGFDPRGSLVGTYVQRNALIVGFAMGFAIVPIIYSLAEDALSEVPVHLREGSLGAGATPWQTTVRIIIPFAMSGIFSALMIGLGRAVGETMIVLMAAGNTPIMEWNIFNGFRTLSANIAVEMPEAVQGSTHYRTLFLAALVLFGMTFILNTVAELVRRHFRARTQSL